VVGEHEKAHFGALFLSALLMHPSMMFDEGFLN